MASITIRQRQDWSPLEVLGIKNAELSFTCVAYAPSRGRRCRKVVGEARRKFAEDIMNLLPAKAHIPDTLKTLLDLLASTTICGTLHLGQADTIATRWYDIIAERFVPRRAISPAVVQSSGVGPDPRQSEQPIRRDTGLSVPSAVGSSATLGRSQLGSRAGAGSLSGPTRSESTSSSSASTDMVVWTGPAARQQVEGDLRTTRPSGSRTAVTAVTSSSGALQRAERHTVNDPAARQAITSESGTIGQPIPGSAVLPPVAGSAASMTGAERPRHRYFGNPTVPQPEVSRPSGLFGTNVAWSVDRLRNMTNPQVSASASTTAAQPVPRARAAPPAGRPADHSSDARSRRERLAHERIERERRAWTNMWTIYRHDWSMLEERGPSRHNEDDLRAIPWPVLNGTSEDLSYDRVRSFFRNAPDFVYDDEEEYRRVLRDERRRWNWVRLLGQFPTLPNTREPSRLVELVNVVIDEEMRSHGFTENRSV